MKHLTVCTVLLVMMSINSNAQIEKEQWKHRLVLIMTSDVEHNPYREQLERLSQQEPEMKERKIKIYRVLPDRLATGVAGDNWEKSGKLYKKYHRQGKDFEVLLIGLDGGVKLHKRTILTQEQLFSAIDAMPMRRAEMRRDND